MFTKHCPRPSFVQLRARRFGRPLGYVRVPGPPGAYTPCGQHWPRHRVGTRISAGCAPPRSMCQRLGGYCHALASMVFTVSRDSAVAAAWRKARSFAISSKAQLGFSRASFAWFGLGWILRATPHRIQSEPFLPATVGTLHGVLQQGEGLSDQHQSEMLRTRSRVGLDHVPASGALLVNLHRTLGELLDIAVCQSTLQHEPKVSLCMSMPC